MGVIIWRKYVRFVKIIGHLRLPCITSWPEPGHAGARNMLGVPFAGACSVACGSTRMMYDRQIMQNTDIPSSSASERDSGDTSTHFGFSSVPEREKAGKVAEVFHSVAGRYDIMNDLMSAGLHRVWKAFTIGRANVRPGMKVLDIAGGTGHLARAFARRAGPSGEVWLTDINDSMLRVGRDRLTDLGLLLPVAVCDAEKLPFPSGYFDRVSVAFGLRNMTHKDQALAEMRRVLKPGG